MTNRHSLFVGLTVLCLGFSDSARSKFQLDSLEQQIQQSEAKFSDIVKGAEKTVSWFAEKGKPTAIAVVYIHGFSATHKELSPFTETLAERLQANAFYTRLKGHGRSDDAMAEATSDDWKKDVKAAYEIGSLLGDRVLLIGTSTGATLTAWLSAQPFADKLLANVMISPNFGINGGGAWIIKSSLGRWLIKQFIGEYRGFEPLNDFHAMYWTERHPVDALVPMLNLVDEVNELDKSLVETPQLLIYSPNDQVINVKKALATAKEFTAAKVTRIPFTTSTDPSQHVLVGKGSTTGNDYQQQVDNMLELILDYIGKLSVEKSDSQTN